MNSHRIEVILGYLKNVSNEKKSQTNKNVGGADKKAQRSNTIAALPEDLSQVPSTHDRRLTKVCTSRFRGPNPCRGNTLLTEPSP